MVSARTPTGLLMNHNYYELSDWQKLSYWLWRRWTLSSEDRFFFEGHRPLPGQMYRAERKALYAAILSRRPGYCFEIGTGSGGGSTFFIAHALRQLGGGKLVTLEASDYDFRKVARRYATDLRFLKPYVELVHGDDPKVFLPYITQAGSKVECILLDGSDTPEQAVRQFEFFLPYVSAGTILMAHDWDDVKMSRLRPRLEQDHSWHVLTRLSHPESVGFVVYEYDLA